MHEIRCQRITISMRTPDSHRHLEGMMRRSKVIRDVQTEGLKIYAAGILTHDIEEYAHLMGGTTRVEDLPK